MSFTYGDITKCKVRNGQTRNEYECRIGYQVNSQDITNNTSNVTLALECRSISSSYTTKGSSGLTSVIDGTTVKSNAAVDMSHTNVWQDFGTRTITIAHNADGTCSVSKSGSFTCTAGSSQYSLSSGSASVTVAPATIPRATTPTVSSSSVNMGSAVTISTPRASSSFTHTLTYSFGSASGTIATGVATSQSWTPPLSLANQVPNGTSGTCTITCYTYNGSTHIGTKSINITLNVPSSIVPSISSVTVSEGGSAVPSSWGVYVKNYSRLKVVTSASGSYSSTITSYKITGIDGNTYNSSDFTSNALTSAGSKTITITVTDSRGRTASTTRTYTCVDYSSPVISSATVARCLSDGTASEEGTYLKYTFKAEVSPVNNKNGYNYKIRYKTTSASSWSETEIQNSSYSLDKENIVLSGVTFSADNAYDIQFYVGDYFTSSKQDRTLSTAFALINFNASGKAIAFGKVSEASSNQKLIEIGMPINLGDEIKGNPTWSVSTQNNVNYNDLKKTGMYYMGTGCTNAPDNLSWVRLWVNGNEGGQDIAQIALYVSDNRYYIRTSANGNWTSWNPILNMHYLGTGINLNNITTPGQYGIYGNNTNTPNSAIAVLEVVKYSPDWILQRVTTISSFPDVYVRSYYNGTTWGSWRKMEKSAFVAYSNSSGTSGTVSLSYSANDFCNIRITYKNDDGQYGTCAFSGVNNCNGTISGSIIRKDSDDTAIMINSALFNISGTTITISRNSQANVRFGGSSNSDTNKLYITKVEMWN